jgi:hypothetical protein
MRFTRRIDWINLPVHSQRIAKRTAARAATVCAARRREREDVDAYLAAFVS